MEDGWASGSCLPLLGLLAGDGEGQVEDEAGVDISISY